MPKFNVGDRVRLSKTNNGSKAFQVLNPLGAYSVEALGQNCSRCAKAGLPNTGSIKVQGNYYCAESFDPIVAANGPQQAQPAAGATAMRVSKDPYSGAMSVTGVEWDDNLPDPTADEHRKLPTLDQLNEEWYKKIGFPKP